MALDVSVKAAAKLLGVFELDESGLVLYCSLEDADGSLRRAHEYDGAHFCTELIRFKNSESFCRRFDHFRMSPDPTHCFDFTFEFENGPSPVRVLLARFRKSQDQVSFLVYVRSASRYA